MIEIRTTIWDKYYNLISALSRHSLFPDVFFKRILVGKVFLLCVGLLFGTVGSAFPDPGFPDPDQRIVPLDEDVYRYLRGMALEAGVLPPSSSLPYPRAEVQSELRRILAGGNRSEGNLPDEGTWGSAEGSSPEANAPSSSIHSSGTTSSLPLSSRSNAPISSINLSGVSSINLSGATQAAWEGIRGYLSQKPFYAEEDQGTQGFAFYPDLRIHVEGYLHSNRTCDQWAYGFHDRKPLIGLLLDTSFFDSLSLYIDLTVQKDPFQVGGDPDNYTNLLTSPSQFDLNMPYRAGLSWGGRHWNLWLGRDRLSWGNGRSGNLLLSDADLYHEGVRFTTWWDRFKFTFLLLGLESWRMETDEKGNPYPWPDASATTLEEKLLLAPEKFKMFLAHRLEFNLRSNLRLTLNESIVYGGKYPDLRVFNPLIVYHSFYIKEWANSLMTIELDWVPFPGVYLYGQYAQDQLSTLFEKETYGKDEEPNAMGYLVGFELQQLVGSPDARFKNTGFKTGSETQGNSREGQGAGSSGKAWLRAGYEFVKTDPWLYIRETPYVSFFSTRRVHSEARKAVLGDKNYYFLHTPLGYQYGPDVVVNTIWISYEVPERYRWFLEYSLILKGENEVTSRFLTGDVAWDLHTPSGTPDVRNIVTFGVVYTVSPKVTVLMEPSFVYNGNLYHEAGRKALDFQLVLGIRYRER